MPKRPDPPPKCHYCNEPAEFLCDFIISTQPHRTCDRPLCLNHRTQVGFMHFAMRSGKKGFGRKHETDSVDRCPGHAHGLDHKPPYVPIGGGRAG